MRIVADTNIYLAVALGEPERESIISLTFEHDLVAPEVLPFEIGNALSAMVKRKRLTVDEVLPVLRVVAKAPVELRRVDMELAMQIALDHGIYAYDAYWLECARSVGCPLLTLDKKMNLVAQGMGLKVLEV